jgi:predicted GIY-YIG superfamily endonuclease
VSSVAREYYVYIMASERQTLYTGVTNDLESRIWQHKNKLVPGFTAKYDCTKLVYYEDERCEGGDRARKADQRAGYDGRRWL